LLLYWVEKNPCGCWMDIWVWRTPICRGGMTMIQHTSSFQSFQLDSRIRKKKIDTRPAIPISINWKEIKNVWDTNRENGPLKKTLSFPLSTFYFSLCKNGNWRENLPFINNFKKEKIRN
jgi:hypothetical protein